MQRTCGAVLVLVFALASTAMAVEFSADSITVMSGIKDAGKIYSKAPDITRNEALGMIFIKKHPQAYQIFPDSKKYVVINIEDLKKQNPMADAVNFEEWIQKHNFKNLGTDNVQGFKSDVYEGKIAFAKGQPPVAIKVWYSKELQYPLKSESTLPPPLGKMSNYLENIKTGPQPDNLFEVPAGYTKEESMQKAMGMGNMKLPIQGGQEQAPSREDMDKLMKQMQKMKEQRQKQ